MKTPIVDFVKDYVNQDYLRLHMPGHKGKDTFGFEKFDITEIDGADVLYKAKGIIKESEDNAADLFGTAKTYYSTEGSSLAIRAMLYLVKVYANYKNQPPSPRRTSATPRREYCAAQPLDQGPRQSDADSYW